MSKMAKFVHIGIAGITWLALIATAPAQPILSEGFDVITSNIPGPGWFARNNSPMPGSTVIQGMPGVFPSQSGATDSYAAMNVTATMGTTGNETISVWLLTPMITLDNGTQISFYTRTVMPVSFPDRLQLRFSTAGASTDVGTTPTSVGDFSNLLVDINPTYSAAPYPVGYPQAWTEILATIGGLGGPTTGRIAFRYFVEQAGAGGIHSEYIGIDTLTVTPVPEPSSFVLAAAGMGLAGWWRRRQRG